MNQRFKSLKVIISLIFVGIVEIYTVFKSYPKYIKKNLYPLSIKIFSFSSIIHYSNLDIFRFLLIYLACIEIFQ